MVKISIVIPAYNCSRYLHSCLESVFQQIYPDFEVVVVDDCSTDGTLQLLSLVNHSNFRFFRNETNLGPLETRKKGVLVSEGDYIAFVDNDDVLSPFYLSQLIGEAEKYDADISCCNVAHFSEGHMDCFSESLPQKPKKHYFSESNCLPFFLSKNRCNSSTSLFGKIIKKTLLISAFSSLPSVSPKMSEDVMLLFPLYRSCSAIIFVSQSLYFVRIRSSSLAHTASYSPRFFWDCLVWHWIFLQVGKNDKKNAILAARRGLKSLVYIAYKSLKNKSLILSSDYSLLYRRYLKEYKKPFDLCNCFFWVLIAKAFWRALKLYGLIGGTRNKKV